MTLDHSSSRIAAAGQQFARNVRARATSAAQATRGALRIPSARIVVLSIAAAVVVSGSVAVVQANIGDQASVGTALASKRAALTQELALGRGMHGQATSVLTAVERLSVSEERDALKQADATLMATIDHAAAARDTAASLAAHRTTVRDAITADRIAVKSLGGAVADLAATTAKRAEHASAAAKRELVAAGKAANTALVDGKDINKRVSALMAAMTTATKKDPGVKSSAGSATKDAPSTAGGSAASTASGTKGSGSTAKQEDSSHSGSTSNSAASSAGSSTHSGSGSHAAAAPAPAAAPRPVAAQPAPAKPAPAPAHPAPAQPAPAKPAPQPAYTQADAWAAVAAYGARPVGSDCDAINYGTWGRTSPAPRPATNLIAAGGWLGASVTSTGQGGTVQYYACY